MPAREATISRNLSAWFKANARDLPWRRKRNGYKGLVSEAMLQQTQVSRVIDRYQTFMKRFPNVQALAASDEQEVLAHWQGLGYYRRARNLHAAAQMVVSELNGVVPDSIVSLRQLPGVGRYTAGAIASIVFGKTEPIVDGNVQRVLSRLELHESLPNEAQESKWQWERAQSYVNSATEPGAFNEALMELGAMVCTPRSPKCEACPLRRSCRAKKAGRQDEIPSAKRSPIKTKIYCHAIIVRRGRKILLEQRGEKGLWSKMWQPPTIESPLKLKTSTLRKALGLPVDRLQHRDTFEHQTTHRQLVFEVYEATTRVRRGLWRSLDDLDDLPLSNAHRKVLRYVSGNG
ncbi:MAG: A/G-specific adenine glycosylase [Planctomycetota bacterium]|nr:A/G-specific adenine glycosylase [Planctomycetota bacterium]